MCVTVWKLTDPTEVIFFDGTDGELARERKCEIINIKAMMCRVYDIWSVHAHADDFQTDQVIFPQFLRLSAK